MEYLRIFSKFELKSEKTSKDFVLSCAFIQLMETTYLNFQFYNIESVIINCKKRKQKIKLKF